MEIRRKGEILTRREGARKRRKTMMSDVEIADRIIVVIRLFQTCHRLQVCNENKAECVKNKIEDTQAS